MKKPESTFIQSVHNHLPPGRSDPYWMKNNNSFTSGIWDVWYSGNRADMWVEYKFVVLPKRDDTLVPVELSELQLDWGNDRHVEGRKLFVIVGAKEGGIILRPASWTDPISAGMFRKQIQSRQQIAQFIRATTCKGA